MAFLPRRRRARTSVPARLTTATLVGTAATVAVLVATDVVAVPSWALDGIDVSSHQHPGSSAIDWNSVAADGESFAFIKATEGTGYTNPYFSTDSAKATAAGVTPGSYHYAKPGVSDARSQARYYAAALATGAQPSLPPTLDLEEDGGLGPAQLQKWVGDWIDEITTLTGREPIIYTYQYFWEHQMGNTTKFNRYPLWLAYYNDSLPNTLPGGWDTVTFWQYSSSGQVDGVITNVDMNKYYGSDEQLQKLAGRPSKNSPVGTAADALAPLKDTTVTEAGAANAVEHTVAQVTGGRALNLPLTTDVLVKLLGFLGGEVGADALLQSARESGLAGSAGNALVEAAKQVVGSKLTLPKTNINDLVGSATNPSGDVDLAGVLRILQAFGADDWAARVTEGSDAAASVAGSLEGLDAATSGAGAANSAN